MAVAVTIPYVGRNWFGAARNDGIRCRSLLGRGGQYSIAPGVESAGGVAVFQAVALAGRLPLQYICSDRRGPVRRGRERKAVVMAAEGGVYRCHRCGQEVTVTVEGLGVLVCCNLPMELVGGSPGIARTEER
jgi:desulfoferrodoxin-like iron-binding protein